MPRILEIVLIDFNEYLKGILQQILASYKILTELNDKHLIEKLQKILNEL